MNKLIIILILLSTVSVKAVVLNKVVVEPLNRTTFYFSDLTEFSSQLSDDKQKITLVFNNSSAGPNQRETTSSGVIQDVLVTQKDNNLEANIILKDSRGYSAIHLPYSRAILVEVFKWDKLSKEDDQMRQALFAWEEKMWSLSDSLLNLSIQAEAPANSKAFLGLSKMMQGYPSKAVKNLIESKNNKTNIPDVYAALSQIYALKGLKVKSKEYSDKFIELTGLKSFPELPINEDIDNITIPNDLVSNDESNDSTKSDSTKVIKEISNKSNKEDLDLFTIENAIIFVLIAGIGFFLLIILLLFNKWKKSKIAQTKLTETRFKEEVAAAREKAERKAKVMKKERGEKTEEEIASEPKAPPRKEDLLSKTYGEIKQKKQKPVDNIEQDQNKDDLVKFLENYIPVKRQEEENSLKKASERAEQMEFDSQETKSYSSPEVDLAMKLAEKMNIQKQKQILNLSEKEIQDNEEEIEKIAKELGLEKSSLETKSLIEKLSSDKDMISKLSQKFSVENKVSKEEDTNKDSEENQDENES